MVKNKSFIAAICAVGGVVVVLVSFVLPSIHAANASPSKKAPAPKTVVANQGTAGSAAWPTQSSDSTTVIASGTVTIAAGRAALLVNNFDFTPYQQVQIYASMAGTTGEPQFAVTTTSPADALANTGGFTNFQWDQSFGLLPPNTRIDVFNTDPGGSGNLAYIILGRRN
jgi:hypothetical protein